MIQIISKSVFDSADRLRAGYGEQGARNAHARLGKVWDKHAASVTFSHRASNNQWRRNNEYASSQLSFKHGYLFDGGGALESELSFSRVDLQLPGSMGDAEFADYLATGRQTDTKDAWKNSARDSKIIFFNTRWEGEVGEWRFKPRLFATHWSHFHPVTGVINVSENNLLYGVDLEGDRSHQLFGPASLVMGVTARRDSSLDAEKYEYADVVTGWGGRISSTLSDRQGALLEEQDTINTLFGVYALESLKPVENLTLDLSVRYDRSMFDIDTMEYGSYSYSTGTYIAGSGASSVNQDYNLWSLSAGAAYALNPTWTLFANVAQSDQVPSSQEIESNTGLQASTARNVELGVKARLRGWQLDASAYWTKVSDEIVSVLDNGQTVFQNAGGTRKLGVELAGEWRPLEGLSLGGSWTYSDITFDSFNEVISSVNYDRSGNRLPYVPLQQYGLWAAYEHASGWSGRVRAQSWGKYWMDNANSEQYGGYDFVTHVDVGYKTGIHRFNLNVENLFDKRYAIEATKDSRGTRAYSGAAPRSVMAYWTVDLEG
ncbi:TonB-dependent receptor [Magnetofaba australis]|uniref:Putative TonB-dependent receptor n=1 Tax=Magnetofaba australis IT-1 TaxID=1434232 RepID=A0A1Y2K9D0_9PROT|nr:TonB-dependent receptor [Magnetofaba australis]OSM07097.1 putative TonB-dependent receptor [Magnetofaba australis IT-1]